jgi:hypothetical protein
MRGGTVASAVRGNGECRVGMCELAACHAPASLQHPGGTLLGTVAQVVCARAQHRQNPELPERSRVKRAFFWLLAAPLGPDLSAVG